jgi:fructose-bisphosphate aldolase, class I
MMNRDQLAKVAQAMVAPGKGILAADESSSTIKKRFDAINVESTEETRRDYREFMFRSEVAMREHISGVILYDETIRQKAKDGTPLVKLIETAGSIPGIKVDLGAKPMPMFPGETITEGLDGLPKRMKEYHELGARFAKWRAVITIGSDGRPTEGAVRANMQALARYAAICQEANVVPIVEPEVLMDGAHEITRTFEVTRFVLNTLYDELYAHRVFLEGSILKPNMVVPGEDAKKATPEEVAAWTIMLFRNCVPVAVPGIAFLSGGQSDVEATANLDAIARLGPHPWSITFSYGRALQAAAQHAWSGKREQEVAGQAAFTHRARMNGLAQLGQWSDQTEKAAA